jgi:hypothetical protein
MRQLIPGPSDLTPEQILEMRELEEVPPGVPPNLNDLCDIALGHRFDSAERRAARIELAGTYARTCAGNIVTRDPLTDLLVQLGAWVNLHRFDDDQDPAADAPDERVVRAFGRWMALR